jgi:hypothetical protein
MIMLLKMKNNNMLSVFVKVLSTVITIVAKGYFFWVPVEWAKLT